MLTVLVLLLMLVLGARLAHGAEPRTIYVSITGSDTTGDGSAGNPYQTIMKGLGEAVAGDTVRVAGGTYSEDVTMTAGVTLQGAGANETTIQIGSVTGEQTVKIAHAGRDTKIDGFTITDNDRIGHAGRGVTCDDASPTISNNIITMNASSHGAGIACLNGSDPLITHNAISHNWAATEGGGVYCLRSSPTILENTITANIAGRNLPMTVVRGGGIYCGASPALISRNLIEHNGTQGQAGMGGGVYTDSGGRSCPYDDGRTDCAGCHASAARTVVQANDIRYNTARGGGGICSGECETLITWPHTHEVQTPWPAAVTSNTISGNEALVGGGLFAGDPCEIMNCVMTDNVADMWGGGAWVMHLGRGETVTNCTISYNRVWYPNGPGAGLRGESDLPVSNCVIWHNSDLRGVDRDLEGCGATYSDISSAEDTAGVGNISVDPSFVDTTTGNYRLRSNSPCIDSGTNTEAPTADRDGVTRPVDGDNDGTAVCDMGAYERAFTGSVTTSLTITAVTDSTSCGTTVTISGALTSDGVPVPGKTVEVWRCTGTTWSRDGTATWNAARASYEATRMVAAKTRFQLRFAGTAFFLPSNSPAAAVSCCAWLSQPWLSRTSSSLGAIFTTSCYLKPRHTAVVRFYFWKLVSGIWKLYTYREATVTGYTSTVSLCRVSFMLPSTGAWRVKAYHRDADHLATWGPARDFTVR